MMQEMNALGRAFGMPSFGMGPASLFTEVPSLQAEMPAMARALAVDIKDTGSALEITADVPGMSKDDIKIQVGHCWGAGVHMHLCMYALNVKHLYQAGRLLA